MGNTCEPDDQQYQKNQPGSRIRNPIIVENMPKSSYAYQVIKPQINQKTNQILTKLNLMKSMKQGEKDLPYFYIVSKKTFYQGHFNELLVPDGKGIAIYQDGTLYEGQFLNGEAQDDNGVIIFPNQGYYKGSIKNSKINGYGKFVHEGIYQYQGQWQNGQPNGKGIQKFKEPHSKTNQIQFKGNFKQGFRQGQGEYVWQKGISKYKGKFNKGLMNDSQGNIITSKSQFKGNFQNGKRQGFGTIITNNGTLEGQFINDMINGQGKFKWKDGKVYQGNFQKSQFNGHGKIIYPNKSVVQGEWKQNHNVTVSKIASFK